MGDRRRSVIDRCGHQSRRTPASPLAGAVTRRWRRTRTARLG